MMSMSNAVARYINISPMSIIIGQEEKGMVRYKYTIVVERDEDGMYVASAPAIQGCYTQGETYEEAMKNIRDAIKLHIDARKRLGEPIPIEQAIDEVEIIAKASPSKA